MGVSQDNEISVEQEIEGRQTENVIQCKFWTVKLQGRNKYIEHNIWLYSFDATDDLCYTSGSILRLLSSLREEKFSKLPSYEWDVQRRLCGLFSGVLGYVSFKAIYRFQKFLASVIHCRNELQKRNTAAWHQHSITSSKLNSSSVFHWCIIQRDSDVRCRPNGYPIFILL